MNSWIKFLPLLLLLGLTGATSAEQIDDSKANPAPKPSPTPNADYAANAFLEPEDLKDFDKQPERVQTLLREALALTKLNLTYQYGSSDPANGGMDCSGTIYYLLQKAGFAEPPRTASSQYAWVRKANLFEAVVSRSDKSFELDELKPGDLLFWTGTYSVDRDPPVTHSMIYLGKEKKTGHRVMVGASDGRSYEGKKRWGVSVFDFKIPKPVQANQTPGAVFIGYAPLPFEELETKSK